jgi:predicted outer membrane repeat protein
LANFSIENSSFKENGAVLAGGALYTQDVPLEIKNTIFETNIAEQGGALFLISSSSKI